MDNYNNLQQYIVKINQVPVIPEKQEFVNKLYAILGLTNLKNNNYKQAAMKFLEVPFQSSSKLWSVRFYLIIVYFCKRYCCLWWIMCCSFIR